MCGDEALAGRMAEHVAENAQRHEPVLGVRSAAELRARVLDELAVAVDEVLVAGRLQHDESQHVEHGEHESCRTAQRQRLVQGCSGAGTREGGTVSPTFSTAGDASPTPLHFSGLKFVQKLVHCCNRGYLLKRSVR